MLTAVFLCLCGREFALAPEWEIKNQISNCTVSGVESYLIGTNVQINPYGVVSGSTNSLVIKVKQYS